MADVKPKLLVVELWNIGDLAIATPFLGAAAARFNVTLLAKPVALDMQPRFWPQINIIPFTAPWTAFKRKYHFWRWPMKDLIGLRRLLVRQQFDVGLSARRSGPGGDPRDHLLLKLAGARERIGFSSLGSSILLTRILPRPAPESHRYENWRAVARAVDIELLPREQLNRPAKREKIVLIHTGARHPARVWPLENFRRLAVKLRARGWEVQIACNSDQTGWWEKNGETGVIGPETIGKLIELTDRAGVFIGNDSGPGHIAAACGVPTFTIFGPQVPDLWTPIHPRAQYVEGKPCRFKPCSDYCRFPRPFCIEDVSEEAVWPRVEKFVLNELGAPARLPK